VLLQREPEPRGDVVRCRYGAPGDRLWVRETWGIDNCGSKVSLAPETWPEGWPVDRLRYNADADIRFGKRPAIHMPRWACRLVLEVTGVRVERLQDISEDDAKAEGVEPIGSGGYGPLKHRTAYMALWDELNFKRGYGVAVNPWVWVVGFKRA
jgi:hypothetical protein